MSSSSTEGKTDSNVPKAAQEIVEYWWPDGQPSFDKWYTNSKDYDGEIAEKFGKLLEDAHKGLLEKEWCASSQGFVALIILMDQFSRQAFRGQEKAFQWDEASVAICERHLDKYLSGLSPSELHFMVHPYMHSEEEKYSAKCVKLCEEAVARGKKEGNEGMVSMLSSTLKYAKLHYDVVKKFGRFPKRNKALGRENTEEEEAYIKETGSRQF